MMDAGVWYAQVERRDWLYVWVKAVSWGLHERVRADVAKRKRRKETHLVLVVHHPDQRYISWGQKRNTTRSHFRARCDSYDDFESPFQPFGLRAVRNGPSFRRIG